MKKIKEITLVLENCESETILAEDIVKFKLIEKESTRFGLNVSNNELDKKVLPKKITAKMTVKNPEKYKNFGRTDVTHIYISFEDLTEQHYVVNWGLKDCQWGDSSLQKTKYNDKNKTKTWLTGFIK